MSAPSTLPTFFISHGGGPCFDMKWDPPNLFDHLASYLRGMAPGFPAKPKAVLVISGHWEEEQFTVMSAPRPSMLFDYYGFPPETYELKYPAPGDPVLAGRVQSLLRGAGIPCKLDASRGFDHGIFVPFRLIYPAADMPIVALSMKKNFDPEEHAHVGEALSALRREGVLIVGSGNSFHNLRFPQSGLEGARLFDEWLTKSACHPDAAVRRERFARWTDAPHARLAQPREDHLVPLFVAAGAAGAEPGRKVYTDTLFGFPSSGYQFG